MKDIKVTFYERVWFSLTNFIDNWIYPGFYLKNLLLNRYDLIKIPYIKSYEYIDVSIRMEFAIFELIKDFIEKENPEKYICWYKDENGNDLGHKYGEDPNVPIIYPELKGKWVMDLIKEIYNFYTHDLKILENEIKYLYEINHKYFVKFDFEECEGNEYRSEDEKQYKLVNIAKKISLDDPEIKNLNWDLILKYIDKKDDLLNDDCALTKGIHKLELEKSNKIQYYLHLAIDIHQYLWT